ncbi:30S ribosomal protein S6 alpha [Forsythia ovata]|uniref:30S ribosomal protein S6 alpha n=1 Tax=Forsythia ovata TaxID=205694 RepID=A0ABD1QA76_9LAMI
MASTSLSSSSPLMVSKSSLIYSQLHAFSSSSNLSFTHRKSSNHPLRTLVTRAEFGTTWFERDIVGSDDPPPNMPLSGSGLPDIEDKEEPQCPPGLRQYESMVVLRPEMSEDERLVFTQKYEEELWNCVGVDSNESEVVKNLQLLVAGGGMYVEVFNRGVIPLAYGIKKKNKAGESNTYLDGIYLLFTYFTKPESMDVLEGTLQKDDDVIRSSSFKIRKRKLF